MDIRSGNEPGSKSQYPAINLELVINLNKYFTNLYEYI